MDAATWGVLNEIRGLREEVYQGRLSWWVDQYARWTAVVGWVLISIGAVGLAGLATIVVARGSDDLLTTLLFAVLLLATFGILFVVGLTLLVRRPQRRRKLDRYAARRGAQDDWQRVLSRLAGPWSGRVECDGVGPACRFLIEHWPDRARQLIINPIIGDVGDRLTLTAVAHGHPVLVQVTDLIEPGGDFSSPVLVVLVAAPLGPAGQAAETVPGRRLTEQGFRIGWCEAGVYASHGGPATALLTEAALQRVVATLVELCGAAPPGVSVAAPAPVRRDRSARPDDVAEEFLQALCVEDALGALACADPLLAGGRLYELRPHEVLAAVERCRARPLTWRPRGGMQAGAAEISRYAATTVDRPPGEIAVHLVRRTTGWRVCGYTVDVELVLGVEHDNSD